MATIYLKSGARMLLYIAIVAMTGYMILDIKNLDTLRISGLSGAILILILSVLSFDMAILNFPMMIMVKITLLLLLLM